MDIAKRQKEREEMEYQLRDLRRQYRILQHLTTYKNRDNELARIEREGKALREKLDGNAEALPVKADTDGSNVRKIAGMLVWASQMLNVYANLTKDQIPFLAADILETYGHLTYEQIAHILKQGVRGEWGEVTTRLDTQIIHIWVRKYTERKKQEAIAQRESQDASYCSPVRYRTTQRDNYHPVKPNDAAKEIIRIYQNPINTQYK